MATCHSLGSKCPLCAYVFKHLDPKNAYGIPMEGCVTNEAGDVVDRTWCVPGGQPSRVVA